MELLNLVQNATLEISVLIFLIYLLSITFCLYSLRNRLGLVVTYIFGFYCCYACNKEVIVQTFGDFLHLFNILFFGFGILLLSLVIYTLSAGR